MKQKLRTKNPSEGLGTAKFSQLFEKKWEQQSKAD